MQDTLFSMLPTGEAVKDVYLDQATGVLAGVKEAATTTLARKLIVECGTIESATILKVGKATDTLRSQLPPNSVLGA